MSRLIVAFSLYAGLWLLSGVILIALLHGASALTAVTRGVVALGIVAVLGCIAGAALRTRGNSGSLSGKE